MSDRTELNRDHLRDEFFALASGSASEADTRRVRARVDATATPPTLELDGLSLSHHPSARFRVLRFIAAERIPAPLRSKFARPSTRLPELAAVFADPEEFSYRSFENIVPLDRWLDGVELELALGRRERLGSGKQPSAYRFPLVAGEATRAALAELDALGLYVAPLNAASRGGRRFIFHSARLAEALTAAVRDALPKPWKAGFVHVNPVFRCNRFEPGDARFSSHVDTPYYDAARRQVSRYTLLIYLTGGRADEPVLRVGDDVSLVEIEPLTCLLFAQALEHEGAAFADGRKVFLRTELIYEEAKLDHDPEIARTFARACYLTGESVALPELAAAAHALYDRAAAAHWSAPRSAASVEPSLRKRFRTLEFVTNGYDYFFARQVSLRECAAVAILDLLNCKVGGRAFRTLCESTVIDRGEPPERWALELLSAEAPASAEPLFCGLDRRMLFPPSEDLDHQSCCPFHAWERWDPARASETVDLYERAQRYAERRLAGAPIVMLGQEIFLDLDKFVVADGKIHVLSDRAIAPLNFAACWNDGSSPENYLDVEVVAEAPHLLVPPILFRETERGYHLMLDLFRNSWMVDARERAVPIPKLRQLGQAEYDDGSWERAPWMEAAAGVQPDTREDDEDDEVDEPWWADEDSELVRELYAETDSDEG